MVKAIHLETMAHLHLDVVHGLNCGPLMVSTTQDDEGKHVAVSRKDCRDQGMGNEGNCCGR
jgi:hypothetical protein